MMGSIMLEHCAYISRKMLLQNIDKLFVFGDNMARAGYGGQAKQMRGCLNAVGIPTKWRPATDLGAYFRDDDFMMVKPRIDVEFDRLEGFLQRGGTVVWPEAGIGTGRAKLYERAPKIAGYIDQRYANLKRYQ